MSNKEITNKTYCPISFDEKLIGKDSIYFTVPGKPVAKQRPKAARKGRFFTVYTPNETKMYEKKVADCYRNRYGVYKLNGSLTAEVYAVFEVPSSESNKRKELMLNGDIRNTKKPDLDNVIKSALDALNDVAYDDDSSINEIYANKQYGEISELRIVIYKNQ